MKKILANLLTLLFDHVEEPNNDDSSNTAPTHRNPDKEQVASSFPLPDPVNPDPELETLLDDFITEQTDMGADFGYYSNFSLKRSPLATAMSKFPSEKLTRLILLGAQRVRYLDQQLQELEDKAREEKLWYTCTDKPEYISLKKNRSYLHFLTRLLIRLRYSPEESDLISLIRWMCCLNKNDISNFRAPIPEVVGAIEKIIERDGLSPTLAAECRNLNVKLKQSRDPDSRNLEIYLASLLDTDDRVDIRPGEAWSDAVLADLNTMGPEERKKWNRFLLHCETLLKSQPDKKWIKKMQPLRHQIGSQPMMDLFKSWMAHYPKGRNNTKKGDPFEFSMSYLHHNIITGMLWACADQDSPDLCRFFATVAEQAYTSVRNIGPRSIKTGNACVQLLGQSRCNEALTLLTVLRTRVRAKPGLACIEKNLIPLARRMGIPEDEIDELAVPAYPLTHVGGASIPIGDCHAEISVDTNGKPQLSWINAKGKKQKSVPSEVKQEFSGELKELKASIGDLQKLIAAQKIRLDKLYMADKTWDYPTWKERYLDHPVVGIPARNCIWSFLGNSETFSGIHTEEGLMADFRGQPLPDSIATFQVALWHPMTDSNANIMGWRKWVEEREILQPFRQAHREIYILSDTEKKTITYSNRFAAQVVKQHQFNSLCGVRGWKNSLRLDVDNELPPPHLPIPHLNLRAEFTVEAAGEDTNDVGSFLYLSTDQVRFYPLNAPMRTGHSRGGEFRSVKGDEASPVKLSEIPEVIFSEVMRDIDLFVNVSSIGNDPTWFDRGPEDLRFHFWRAQSLGSLSEYGKIRLDLLTRIVPGLSIASRCSFSTDFLVVQGDLGTYKIHVGTGNVLKMPNEQFICIVKSGRLTKEKHPCFIPYEGDDILTLILSKALMLANDTAITDPTILSQINSRIE